MKRRNLMTLLMGLMLTAFAFSFTSCGETKKSPYEETMTKLETCLEDLETCLNTDDFQVIQSKLELMMTQQKLELTDEQKQELQKVGAKIAETFKYKLSLLMAINDAELTPKEMQELTRKCVQRGDLEAIPQVVEEYLKAKK